MNWALYEQSSFSFLTVLGLLLELQTESDQGDDETSHLNRQFNNFKHSRFYTLPFRKRSIMHRLYKISAK